MGRIGQFLLVLGLSCFLVSPQAQGFIEREYTLHEVLDACTHIVFGKVKSVDEKRLRGTIAVEKDVKGKSNLSEIKMNFATGQYMRQSSPQKIVSLLKEGMPIIVFYRESYAIDCLAYIDNNGEGVWFQTRSHSNYADSWWSFTHIDPMMSRTFSRSTQEFQQVVKDILDGKKWVDAPKDAIKVLVLTGNGTQPMYSQVPVDTNTASYEYHAIRSIQKAGERALAYEPVRDASLPGLEEADILWIGQGEIANHQYLLNPNTETKIKQFVKAGGIVIVSGQDSDTNRPCGIGWLEGKLTGVERPPTQQFEVTQAGRSLFSTPNQINPGQLLIDDAWTDWDKSDTIFATANGGKDLVVGARAHGKGLYIITSMRNDDPGTVALNKNLIENILYYAAEEVKK